MQMVIKYLKGPNEVESIEKADAHVHTTLILNGNSIRAISFRRKV